MIHAVSPCLYEGIDISYGVSACHSVTCVKLNAKFGNSGDGVCSFLAGMCQGSEGKENPKTSKARSAVRFSNSARALVGGARES